MKHSTATTVLAWFISLAAATVAVVCIEYLDWIGLGLSEVIDMIGGMK